MTIRPQDAFSARALTLAGAILAGMLGIGFQAPPSANAARDAVRASLIAAQTRASTGGAAGSVDLETTAIAAKRLREADVVLERVRRDWIHELLSSKPSRFLVDASVTPQDGTPPDERVFCLVVERQVGDIAIASSPHGNGACGTFGW